MDLEASRAELEARANLATALLAQSLAETRSTAAERDTVFADRARIILELDRIAAAAESRGAELQALIGSTSWRITRPLRWAARRWAAISGRSAR